MLMKNLNLSKLKFVHVAGTKGKGTTCAFTESILRGQGLKTGFFTSPHLVSPCERIRINGKPISEEKFEEYFDFCYENLHNSGKEEHLRELSFFKMTFLMSLKCFLEEKVDVAIIEVGIGGRFDFTNLITPEVCGITLIEFDHVITLGNTISSIAHHKAGIIKVSFKFHNILNNRKIFKRSISKTYRWSLSKSNDQMPSNNLSSKQKCKMHPCYSHPLWSTMILICAKLGYQESIKGKMRRSPLPCAIFLCENGMERKLTTLMKIFLLKSQENFNLLKTLRIRCKTLIGPVGVIK